MITGHEHHEVGESEKILRSIQNKIRNCRRKNKKVNWKGLASHIENYIKDYLKYSKKDDRPEQIKNKPIREIEHKQVKVIKSLPDENKNKKVEKDAHDDELKSKQYISVDNVITKANAYEIRNECLTSLEEEIEIQKKILLKHVKKKEISKQEIDMNKIISKIRDNHYTKWAPKKIMCKCLTD
ncbi:hypothetical protein QTN25_004349 [Entamoeba marina]